MFHNGFPSVGKFCSCCLNFHGLSLKLKRDPLCYHIAYDYSRAAWDGLHDHLRDVPWENIFKLGVSAAAKEFCKWVQVGIDVYIHRCKNQFKPHSSQWFLAACAAGKVQRNHCFCFHQQNKSSESTVKFKQGSNHYKRVLKAAKLAYANKTKCLSLPRNFALQTFSE